MGVAILSLLLIVGAWGKDIPGSNHVVGTGDVRKDTSDRELKLVFTVRQKFQLTITPATLHVCGSNDLRVI